MNKRFKKLVAFILSMAVLLLTTIGTAATNETTVTYEISDLEGKYKTQGRTPIVDGAVMLDWSASGIEWKANCLGDVSITVNATRIETTGDLGGLYFSVYVDGVMQAENLRIPEDNSQENWRSNSTDYPFHITEIGESQFTIATNLEYGEHTFAIYNQTQAGFGAFGVKAITLNGNFLEPPADKELYVEVVGDSIAASHGILATNNDEPDQPLYEDATRAWPFLTAQALNADWSVIAKSGIPAIDGIGWIGANSVNMQDVYPYERYYSDKNTLHDFENSRQPDIIVLCLGTNDCWTWNGTGGTTPLTDDQKIDGFKTMLTHLRDRNTDAKIIWIYGMMTNDADSYIQQAVSDMGGTEAGYYTLKLPKNRSGGNGHPDLSSQTTYAELVSEKINEVIDDIIDTPDMTLDIWDGTETTLTNGTGTEEDPFLISTPEELAYVIRTGGKGKFYKLTADIYLNDTSKIDWQDGTVAADYTVNQWYKESTSSAFYGVLDGDGHTVYGMYITDSTSNVRMGLISWVQEGIACPTIIKNLGVDFAYVNAPNGYAGAIVGRTRQNNTTTFDNCYIGANVTVSGAEAGLFCGRGGTDVVISNSYSLGTVTGTSHYGIIGNCWGNTRTIDNSFFVNALITTSNKFTCANVYTTNTVGGTNALQLTADNMQGLDALTNADKMPGLAECGAFTATESYPILNVFYKEAEGGDETELDIWDGTEIAPTKGTGTEKDPYLISRPGELAYLNAVYVGTHNYYKLTADIYLNDITKINWQDGTVEEGYTVNQWYKNTTPNWFNGVLDGDGHTVYGMYVTDETNDIHLGLLQGTRQNGQITIKNLGIDCAYVNAPNGDAAAFAGLTQSGTTTFDTCYAGANVKLTGANAGSFCGRAGTSLVISKSYSLATVTGTTRYGAAVGDCWGSTRTIDNSFFVNGPVTSHTGHGFICTNVYTTNIVGAQSGAKQLTTDNMQGFDVLTNADKMSGLAECGAFTATKAYPVLTVFVREPVIEIWDGIAVKPIKGTGTEEDPYLISRPGELAYLNAVYVGTHTYYKLTADIYLNDITKINWQDGTIEEGYTVNQWYKNTTPNWFNGVLDGDGHTVYGMYVTDETNDIHLGLLQGTRQNGQITIKNLGIDCAYVNAPNGDAAAFVGITQSGTTTFDTCYVGANVTLTGANAGSFCGRAGTSLAISKSYSISNVTGTTRYGSAVGDCWGSARTIDNSFFTNAPITSHTGHGFTCTNVYATNIIGAYSGAKQLTTDNMQGFDALTNADKMSGLAECGAFTATKSYPVPNIFYKGAEGGEEVELEIWDGTETAPTKGTGTEEDPYLISRPGEFAYIIKNYKVGKFYKLTADIYLNDITKINWQDGTVDEDYTVNQWYNENTSNRFAGVIDGDGHTVYGMYISDSAENIGFGLIPNTQQGGDNSTTIKNLGIDCVYVNAPNGYAGAFVGRGRHNNTTTFDTCYIGANVTVNGADAGLFYGGGGTNVIISNSYSLGTVTGTTYGVVGNCWGGTRTIDNSFFVNTPITKGSNKFTCTNVYATNISGAQSGATQLTAVNMQGLDALINADKMPDLAECRAFEATESYPVLIYSTTKYTVTFNPNGGTVSTESIEAVANAVIKLPIPLKGGYIFKAWYANEELTIQATNIMPAENVTYYAKWYKLYDVSNDDEVDSSDLVQLRELLLGLVSLETDRISIDGADCNQDGQINIVDLVRLKKLLSGEFVRAEYLGNVRTSGQDGAVFGNYLFHFDAQGSCSVYSLEEISNVSVPIDQFVLDKTDKIVPHSNSVMFSNTYYDEGDEFPLLYSNVYNNYAKADQKRKGVTCVYRVEREGNSFSTTLVQVIEVGFTEDLIWKSENCEDARPYGNFTIDTQNSLYYAFTMRDEEETTRYFSFNLPDVNSGNYDDTFGAKHVVLEKTDIIDYFDCEYHRYIQGACFENGIIYSLEGFTDDKNNPPAIRLIDTNAKAQKEMYYFSDSGLTIEPEFIDFEDGICYYADHNGNLYKLIF